MDNFDVLAWSLFAVIGVGVIVITRILKRRAERRKYIDLNKYY